MRDFVEGMWNYNILFLLYLFPFVYSQEVKYRVDTLYLPRKIFDTKYAVRYKKVCFNNSGERMKQCKLEPWEDVFIKGDKIFIYRVLDVRKLEDKSAVSAYELSLWEKGKDFTLLLDTVKILSYFAPVFITPYFVGNDKLVLVGDDLIIINYKINRTFSYYDSLRSLGYKYFNKFSVWNNGINIADKSGNIYAGFLRTSSRKQVKNMSNWYKTYSPVMKFRISEDRDKIILQLVDSLGEFPRRVCLKHYEPYLNPVVQIDTLLERMYLSFPYVGQIDEYSLSGYKFRSFPVSQPMEVPSSEFVITKDYIYLFWTDWVASRSSQFLRILDKHTGKLLGELNWDKTLKHFIEESKFAGREIIGNSVIFYFLDNYSYSGTGNIRVYKLTVYL